MGINRAVALLHSFQFSRAIDDFNVALGADATCTIAYWGIALSDWGNPFAPGKIDERLLQVGRESAERGETLGAKTARERAYLAAVAADPGDKTYADQLKAGAIRNYSGRASRPAEALESSVK